MRKEISLTKWDLNRANKFADERTSTDLYKKRGGFKRDDIVNGALAEIGAYKLLIEHGYDVAKPDFTIHSKGKKSYDADLTDGSSHFHIKGQSLSSVERYGKSWLMQRKDPILSNPKQKHYLVPSVVDTERMIVYIYGIIPIKSIVEKELLSECKLEWFRKYKVALYLDQMNSILTKNALWGAIYRGGK